MHKNICHCSISVLNLHLLFLFFHSFRIVDLLGCVQTLMSVKRRPNASVQIVNAPIRGVVMTVNAQMTSYIFVSMTFASVSLPFYKPIYEEPRQDFVGQNTISNVPCNFLKCSFPLKTMQLALCRVVK